LRPTANLHHVLMRRHVHDQVRVELIELPPAQALHTQAARLFPPAVHDTNVRHLVPTWARHAVVQSPQPSPLRLGRVVENRLSRPAAHRTVISRRAGGHSCLLWEGPECRLPAVPGQLDLGLLCVDGGHFESPTDYPSVGAGRAFPPPPPPAAAEIPTRSSLGPRALRLVICFVFTLFYSLLLLGLS
jgi:hypothetical protein